MPEEPHDRSHWTDFELAVAAVLDDTGPGELFTYGEVAAEAGYPGAARAVGNFLKHAPDDAFPWWRVVTSTGRLAPGAPAEHAERLRDEGFTVRGNHVVRRT